MQPSLGSLRGILHASSYVKGIKNYNVALHQVSKNDLISLLAGRRIFLLRKIKRREYEVVVHDQDTIQYKRIQLKPHKFLVS